MIHVKFHGHIKTSMGAPALELPGGEISVDDLFGRLLISGSSQTAHGFTKYNTLLVINDGEVFAAASQKERRIRDGDSVLLVPFSHGG